MSAEFDRLWASIQALTPQQREEIRRRTARDLADHAAHTGRVNAVADAEDIVEDAAHTLGLDW